jgi:hypothetical protein
MRARSSAGRWSGSRASSGQILTSPNKTRSPGARSAGEGGARQRFAAGTGNATDAIASSGAERLTRENAATPSSARKDRT